VKPITPDDRESVKRLLLDCWGSIDVVSRGRLHHAEQLPGFIAYANTTLAGVITYRLEDDRCEIVTLNSLRERLGIGTALIDEVKKKAIEAGCHRLWLITTNDNTDALRFYQRKALLSALFMLTPLSSPGD
jgi:ribosomal protein S18 acetylase RimI-like enzyme